MKNGVVQVDQKGLTTKALYWKGLPKTFDSVNVGLHLSFEARMQKGQRTNNRYGARATSFDRELKAGVVGIGKTPPYKV